MSMYTDNDSRQSVDWINSYIRQVNQNNDPDDDINLDPEAVLTLKIDVEGKASIESDRADPNDLQQINAALSSVGVLFGDGASDLTLSINSDGSLSIPTLDAPNPMTNYEMVHLLEQALSYFSSSASLDRASETGTNDFLGKLFDHSSMLIMVAYLKSLTNDGMLKNVINIQQASKNDNTKAHEEQKQKILEADEKRKDAQKSGLVDKVFGWIATAFAVLTAAILIASGVGAAVGACLLTAALLMVAMQVDTETGGHMISGMAKWFEAMGVPKDYAELAAQIFVMVVIIALSIVGGVGASRAATNAAKLGVEAGDAAKVATTADESANAAKLSEVADQTAKVASTKMDAVSNKIFAVLQLAEGMAMIGQGSAAAVHAVDDKATSDLQAESKRLAAYLQKLMAVIEGNNTFLSELMKKLAQDTSTIASILKSDAEAHTATISNMTAVAA